jgi:two-component system, NtrC family, nitrogen regulation sensor histidine kinase NtrY
LQRDPKSSDWEADMSQGLAIISSRAESLTRFMEAYSTLARLPPPNRKPVAVGEWIQRVARLETRTKVTITEGPQVTIQGDADQLDQLLINLLRNAADAALETNGRVRLNWRKLSAHLEVLVEDDGPGISNTGNLFVPFFTTKPKGTGIGLVLCRQIAEAHGGTLSLENRPRDRGCHARLRLPLTAH